MGVAERREREKEQRRQAILDAAEHLFFKKGVEDTTMDDVAEAAEFSKGTLYLYFKNREDIYHGIYHRGMEVLKTIKHRWPDSEVIVVTGYPSIESAKEAVRLGAFNYLTKPLGPDEVIKAANDAVIQKRWSLRSQNEFTIN